MKKYMIVVISGLLVCLTFVTICEFYFQNLHDFSKEKWNDNIWKRQYMIKDLAMTYNLYEMNEAEVINLLGQNGIVEDSHLVYYVGKHPVGPVLFSIDFGNDGYVSHYGVIVD